MAGKNIKFKAQKITNAVKSDVTVASTTGFYKNAIVWVNNHVDTPVNDTHTTANVGGTLVPDTYWYRVSATNDSGETLASAQTSIVVPAGTNTNIVTVKWLQVLGATGYKVYGRTQNAELLIASVSGGATLSYVDDGSITPAGALPTAESTQGISKRCMVLKVVDATTLRLVIRDLAPGTAPIYGSSDMTPYIGGYVTQHEQFVYNSNDKALT